MNKYNKDNLSATLNSIRDLSHKAIMELHEVKMENEAILKMLEHKQSTYSEKIVTGVSHLIGRTIKKVTKAPVDWNNYSEYLFIECEDGQRVCIIGNLSETIRFPVLSPEKMKETGFYTEDEIQRRISFIANEEKRKEEERIQSKKRELDKLKKELEAEDAD